MRELYPPIEPIRTGMLDVGEGQRIFWQESGRRDGKPVLVLHGGPGAGSSPEHRRAFDPERYRIFQFDQRGCGRSTPRVSGPAIDLTPNTTWHLVGDIERLRTHLGIRRWQVFGGSWGSTLALAYAEQHPDRVEELVLRGVFTARREEIDWFFGGGISTFHPEAWRRLLEPLAAVDRLDDGVLEGYGELLAHPDPAVHGPAAAAFAASELICAAIEPATEEIALIERLDHAYPVARLEHHYFSHRAWLEEAQLLRRSTALAGIPTAIVQGRCDMLTPPVAAFDLAEALTDARLELVEGAGHAFEEPGIIDGLVSASDRFAGIDLQAR